MNKGNILYLYETGVGLGHQRRASGIVNALADEGFRTAVASGTFVSPEHYFDPRLTLISLPANRRAINGDFYYYNENNDLVRDPSFDMTAWQQTRVAAIGSYIETQRLDAVIAEWWPFERQAQFNPLINAALERQEALFGQRPLIVSSVRDVLTRWGAEKEQAEKIRAAEARAVGLINDRVDRLLVHGDPTFMPLEESFASYGQLNKPVSYTGYVVQPGQSSGYGQRGRTVIVSCGSGDKGHNLLCAAFRARALSDLRDHDWVYVLGPRMLPEERHHFNTVSASFNQASGAHRVVEEMPDLPQRLYEAAFHISFAGYNTTLETLASRVPGILVPKFRFDDDGMNFDAEQWQRLRRLEEGGMATIAHPADALEPRRFAAIIDAAFRKGSPSVSLNTDGARTTARIVGDMVESARRTCAPAPQVA